MGAGSRGLPSVEVFPHARDSPPPRYSSVISASERSWLGSDWWAKVTAGSTSRCTIRGLRGFVTSMTSEVWLPEEA